MAIHVTLMEGLNADICFWVLYAPCNLSAIFPAPYTLHQNITTSDAAATAQKSPDINLYGSRG
jgi:hypothetical protein